MILYLVRPIPDGTLVEGYPMLVHWQGHHIPIDAWNEMRLWERARAA